MDRQEPVLPGLDPQPGAGQRLRAHDRPGQDAADLDQGRAPCRHQLLAGRPAASPSSRRSTAATTTTSRTGCRACNPGGTNTRDYRFNDLNGNRLYDGPQELGALVASAGGTSTTIDPDLKTPYADEFSVSYERQFWGESSFRAAYVRKMTRDEFATYNVAARGSVHRADHGDGQRAGLRERRHAPAHADPVRHPGQPARPGAERRRQHPRLGGRRRLQLRHPAVRLQQALLAAACSSRAASTTSGATSCAQNSRPSTSPLNSDPLGIDYFQNVFPDVSEPPGEHQLAGPSARPLRLPVRSRSRRERPRAERLGLLATAAGGAAERRHADVLRREHREQPLGHRHAGRPAPRQGVHASAASTASR